MNSKVYSDEVSREMQSAFVDGQLDSAEWAAMLERIGADPALRREICELRATKDMVRGAYSGLTPARRGRLRAGSWRGWGLAASLVAGIAAGWVGHGLSGTGDDSEIAGRRAGALRGVSADHILVHVSSGNRETLATALDEVEDLLRSARSAGREIAVEIVANSTGLDLLRVNASPYLARVAALRREYPNLSFVACHQTIERLREKGVAVELLPGVQVAPSALDQVVKRLQGGWVYIRA
jgi:intracellular sulfur oxidation DsrE/DsrF family protein